MNRVLTAAAMLMISGCATTGAADADEPPVAGAGNCDATATARLVGQAATAELGTEVLRLTSARTIRWIQPGTVVTMDYRMDRANVELDGDNRVSEVRCG